MKENKDEYRWTKSTEKAFQEMKKVIVELPLLTTLVKEETLSSGGNSCRRILLTTSQGQNKYDVEKWTLFTNGASDSKGFGDGLVLISPSSVEFTYALRLSFTSTNNEAEYEAFLARLRTARNIKVQDIDVRVDSKLGASHINKISLDFVSQVSQTSAIPVEVEVETKHSLD
nr:ribonuclease H-like domain-containing protein [Tanacetum cinerariifolium]